MVNIVWEGGEIPFVAFEFVWHQSRMCFVMPDRQDGKVSALWEELFLHGINLSSEMMLYRQDFSKHFEKHLKVSGAKFSWQMLLSLCSQSCAMSVCSPM